MATQFARFSLGGFAVGALIAVLLPDQYTHRFTQKWGFPYKPQAIYYKGNQGTVPPSKLDSALKPVENRIMQKLQEIDLRDDEDLQQMKDRHDDVLLEIERKELEWVEQQSKQTDKGLQARLNEYEAAKRVQSRQETQGGR